MWQSWLPEKHRARGPRVERKQWGPFRHLPGARYEMTEEAGGLWGDAWYFDDKLIYVHKRFVAIPLAATRGGHLAKVARPEMVIETLTYA